MEKKLERKTTTDGSFDSQRSAGLPSCHDSRHEDFPSLPVLWAIFQALHRSGLDEAACVRSVNTSSSLARVMLVNRDMKEF
jgi:hypothetical protein